jgi:fermentation-respiration switch protein FrsA (DUF1100 family)
MEERPVAFQWRDDDGDQGGGEGAPPPPVTLRGTLALPQARNAAAADCPPTAVLLAHGYLSNRDGIPLFPALARALAESHGIASLRFDFRGAGESDGETRLGDYEAQARQIDAARRFLERGEGAVEKQEEVPLFRVIGVLGHSKASTAALLNAADWARRLEAGGPPTDPPPPLLRLVALSGRFFMDRGLGRHFPPGELDALLRGERPQGLPVSARELAEGVPAGRAVAFALTERDARERMAVDPRAAAEAVARCERVRVLVVHGSADRAVPAEDGGALYEALAKAGAGARARMVMIEGADHNFRRAEHLRAALEPIVAFLVEEGAGRR